MPSAECQIFVSLRDIHYIEYSSIARLQYLALVIRNLALNK